MYKRAFLAACLLTTAHALSWPLCENGGSVWVTERPSTGSKFPGANLWFFCEGTLNVLGDSVDPCIDSGSLCTGAVNDAICQFLGYDHSYDASTVERARPDEVVRSLTGEYCLRQGMYSDTMPQDLAELPGEPCQRIQAITCIRTIERMAEELERIVMDFTMSNAPEAEALPPQVLGTLPPPLAAVTNAPAAEGDGLGP